MKLSVYDWALNSHASYVDLYDAQQDVIESQLRGVGLTEWQARYFFERFTLQYGSSYISGLDAFVISEPSGGTTVAFRGTEFNFGSTGDLFSSLMDVLSDGALASGLTSLLDFFHIGQTSSIDRFLAEAGLITEEGEVVEAYKGQVTFTGHSLGGHLALLAAYKYPDLVKHVYTFNGAGIAPLDRLWFDHIAGLVHDRRLDTSKITNLYADKGIELTAADNGWFRRPGRRQEVFIEQSDEIFENHSIARLVKSLAVYRVLQHLDNELLLSSGMRDIYRMLDATSYTPDDTLERFQAQLAEWALLGNEPGVSADIELLYRALEQHENAMLIKPLSAMSPSALYSMANDDTQEGRAARYGLLNSQAMSIIAGIPSGSDGALFDPQVFSSTYWQDRSRFYVAQMAVNRSDSLAGGGHAYAPGSVTYSNAETGTVFTTAAAMDGFDPLRISYNRTAGGSLSGHTGDDHLYGSMKADSLHGLDGNDRLEGMDGDDTLAGGDGHDVFAGGKGHDTILLSWNHPDEGHDRVEDTFWAEDSIRINDDRFEQATRKEGFSSLYTDKDEAWLLLKADNGYLLLDRENGFANSLWLPVIDAASKPLSLLEPEPMDIAALLGPPHEEWYANEHYGKQVLEQGHSSSRYQFDTRFWGNADNDLAIGGHLDDELYGYSGDDWLQGNGGMDLIAGGAGSDYLYGGEGRDFLLGQHHQGQSGSGDPLDDRNYLDGGEGGDWMRGGNGEDTLIGQAGNDYMYGAPGNDWLSGGSDDDHVWGDSSFGLTDRWVYQDDDDKVTYRYFRTTMGLLGSAGLSTPWQEPAVLTYNDVIDGGDGDDWLFGELGDDVLYGGNQDDVLVGDRINVNPQFDESIFLYGFTQFGDIYSGDVFMADDPVVYSELPVDLHGNDVLVGGAGDDDIYGNAGHDLLQGGSGRDYLHGDDNILEQQSIGGNDRLFGDGDNDHLLGGFGDDYLDGGDDNDVLRGGMGRDSLFGGVGNDRLFGDDGSDVLYGNAGMDYLYGGNESDFLSGDDGNDYLSGDDGNDMLSGGAGNDRLVGEAGDDCLEGGEGNDYLEGGDGFDIYRFFYGDGHDALIDEDGNTAIHFEGGITRDDLFYTYHNGYGFLSYSPDGRDVIEIRSTAVAPLYQIRLWETDKQAYKSLSLDAIQAGRFDDSPSSHVIGTDYNDFADLTNVALENDDWHGGNGDDIVITGMNNGHFYGEWGNDTLIAGELDVTLYGGTGNDTLVAGGHLNRLEGGLDDDLYDIGLFRPYIIENPDAGYDVIAAEAAGDETLELPAHIEALELSAAGHAITLLSTEGRQEYRVDSASVRMQMAAGAGVDVLKTDAPITLSFPDAIAMENIFMGFENGVFSVRYGNSDALYIETSAGGSLQVNDISLEFSGKELHWFPVAPVQYVQGSESDDYWTTLDIKWLNRIAPMVSFSDSGGFDVLVTSFFQEPQTLSTYEVIQSGNDLVLRLEDVTSNRSSEWMPDVQWRLENWFAGPDYRIEVIGGSGVPSWRQEDAPIESSITDVIESNHVPTVHGLAYYTSGLSSRLPLMAFIRSVEDQDGDAVSLTDIWGDSDAAAVSSFADGFFHMHLSEGDHRLFYRVTDGAGYATAALDMHVTHADYAWGMLGEATSNVFDGGHADDAFWGGSGSDWLWGAGGDDRLVGGGGDDVLDGGAGNDKLRASSGNDQLSGGAGNDFLRGDGGNDFLQGGAGDDVYIYSLGDGDDLIKNQLADETLDPFADHDVLTITGLGSIDDIWLRQDQDDLLISFIDAGDGSIRIDDWFNDRAESAGSPEQLWQIRADTANGRYTLDNSQMLYGRDGDAFDRLFYAMSGYEQPVSADFVPDAVRQASIGSWLAA